MKRTSDKVDSLIRKRTFNLITPKTLTVAIYADFYPIAYISNATFKGLDVDIMKLFAKIAGLKITFQRVSHFNEIWLEPAKGNADVAIGGIGMMPRRLDPQVEWTMPYFHVMRTVVYNKRDPIKKFPQDVHRTVLGTFGSTGWLDSELRAKPFHKDHFMQKGSTDKEDIKALEKGQVQGLMRGSFVGQAIVHQHKKILGMAKPWEMDPSLLTSDGEVFAYPTRLGSGLAVGLSAFLIELQMNGHLHKLLKKYHLE